MKHTIAIAVGALALGSPLAAQQVVSPIPPGGEPPAVEAALQLERARVGVETRFVKGAPYSGEAVTETLQVLSDGNRISRKSVTRIYRDSEGRTRRENLDPNGEVTSINISDPVGESQYTLNPATKTAYRNGVIMASGRGGFATARVEAGSEGSVIAMRTPEGYPRVEARSAEADHKADTEKAAAAGAVAAGGGGRGAGAGGTIVYPAEVPPTGTLMRTPTGANTTRIDLGQQTIEGLLATGSRSTTVIPAGAIGNDQPINVISEQWFSEELQVLVMTKHSDPRSGQTIYRLLNVVQVEPHRSQFEVPPDYTLKDSVIRRQ
jgi:hypothetical protein